MSDPLTVIIRSAQQPTFEELRDQFREENRQRVHRMLREDTITFRDKDGFFLRYKNGTLVKKRSGYLTDAPLSFDGGPVTHRRLDEYRAEGGRIPDEDWGDRVEFAVVEGPGLDRELRDLSRDAAGMAEAERVEHPEVVSFEGPPLQSLDDESVVNYIDKVLDAGALRCLHTGNPCGTDTWEVDHPCQCSNCKRWMKETNVSEDKCSGTYAGIDRSVPSAFSATVDSSSGTLTPEVLNEFIERTKGS